MTTPLDFPTLSIDAWAQTAPMAFEDEMPKSGELAPCPWGFEMMGADCTIEHADGRRLTGGLVQWDPSGNRCLFSAAPDHVELTLPLTRLRQVTLTQVLPPGASLGALGWGDPAAQARLLRYQIELDGGQVLLGTALHHVVRPEGHYFAQRVSAAGAFVRLFVPTRAIAKAEIGDGEAPDAATAGRSSRTAAQPVQPTASATARVDAPPPIVRFEPVTTLRALQQAIEAQARQPVRRLGDILVSLDLVTVEQLATTLSQGQGNGALPLGERLVRMGLVSPEGMQRALHLKMGYPMVDLQRFAFDRELLKRLPLERAMELEVLLLGRTEAGAVVVALDDPGRLPGLQTLRMMLGAQLVAALPFGDPVRRIIPKAYGTRDVFGTGVGWFG